MDDLERVHKTLTSRHWTFTWLSEPCPQNLLAALREKLPHIEPESWDERLRWGGVYLNGRSKSADEPLRPPCRVEYYEPKFPIERAQDFFPPLTAGSIVYEDDDILAVYKPPRLPCLPTREQRHFNLRRQLSVYLREKGLEIEPHLPSRVDTSVQGLVVASKSIRMHRALQRIFEKRLIDKVYLLEVEGLIDWEHAAIDEPIAKDPRHPVLRRLDKAGKPSSTEFRRVCESSVSIDNSSVRTTILEAHPLTGRTHQIRLHARGLGKPIVGDNFYQGLVAEQLHLLSYRFRFTHPFTGRTLQVTLPRRFLPEWAIPAAERIQGGREPVP